MRQLFSAAIGLCLALAGAGATADALLTNITRVDVETGALRPGQSVLIEGTQIAAAGPDLSAGAGVARIDGNGGYLIPGLWDSHVHVFSSEAEPDTALPLYLINGITGIRPPTRTAA